MRGAIVRLDEAWQQVQSRRASNSETGAYPPPVRALLGQMLAAGVLMEGKSVEDNGEGVLFCVFAYNMQPGVSIDYATGESSADGTIVNDTSAQEETSQSEETQTYVLNTNTHKFHKPGCYSVEKIKPENYAEFTGTREEAIAYGYDPCKNCNP